MYIYRSMADGLLSEETEGLAYANGLITQAAVVEGHACAPPFMRISW